MIEKWRCANCGKTWEILCEGLSPEGPSQVALGGYDFLCPTQGCGRRFRDDDPKEFGDTTIPIGLSTRPLKYREEGASDWRDIRDGIDK
jgi:hypothetical protein